MPGLHLAELLLGIVIGVLLTSGVWLARRRAAGRAPTGSAEAFEERRRIARELHDGIGHGLLVIAMHARALPALAPQTRPVAQAIDETVSDVLSQVRSAVGVLRSGRRPPAGGWLAPLSAQVAALISNLPSGAPAVRLAIRGVEQQLGARVGDVALRLVQEALTNACKHGGDLPVRVDLGFGERLEVSVTSGTGELVEHVPSMAGYGLNGMCEGVVAEGGRFECGPLTGGGFLVRASLPIGEKVHEARAYSDRG
ncbi:sensor histidine kinase [Nonomuraea typhae]|uniref:sensor histidine kinase n=1 Tax=Nonomuraea typhae TaxID=2603600 RepID=UPI0015E1D9B5|nr:histidine kinase [Nonomuraea typhae]